MKTMIALGLAMLSVLLVVVLRHTGTSPHPFPEAEPASTEAPQTLMTADPCRATSPALRATESWSNPFTPFSWRQPKPKPILTTDAKPLSAR
jgi:hypothetical protein